MSLALIRWPLTRSASHGASSAIVQATSRHRTAQSLPPASPQQTACPSLGTRITFNRQLQRLVKEQSRRSNSEDFRLCYTLQQPPINFVSIYWRDSPYELICGLPSIIGWYA